MYSKRKTRKNRHLKSILSSLIILGAGFLGGYQVNERISPPSVAHIKEGEIHMRRSPKGGCEAMLIRNILNAKKSLDILIYCFSSKEIADAILTVHKRGVRVRIVADNSQRNVKNSQLPRLHQNGMPIYIATGVRIMHHKVCIIDHGKGGVLTGSYNYTWSAKNKNAENLLWIKNKDVSKFFQNEMNNFVNTGRTYTP